MNGTEGPERGLERPHIGQHPFRCKVEMMKVSGLRFTQQGLHVEQSRHLLMTLIERIGEGPRRTN